MSLDDEYCSCGGEYITSKNDIVEDRALHGSNCGIRSYNGLKCSIEEVSRGLGYLKVKRQRTTKALDD